MLIQVIFVKLHGDNQEDLLLLIPCSIILYVNVKCPLIPTPEHGILLIV